MKTWKSSWCQSCESVPTPVPIHAQMTEAPRSFLFHVFHGSLYYSMVVYTWSPTVYQNYQLSVPTNLQLQQLLVVVCTPHSVWSSIVTCLSRFQGGRLPYSLSSLTDPRRVMNYHSVQLFPCKEGSGDPQALCISELQLEAAEHLDISYLIGSFFTLEIFWYCCIKRWKHSLSYWGMYAIDPSEFTTHIHPTLSPIPLLWPHFKWKGEGALFYPFFDDQTSENNPSQNDLSKVAASKHYVLWKKKKNRKNRRQKGSNLNFLIQSFY